MGIDILLGKIVFLELYYVIEVKMFKVKQYIFIIF